MALRGAWWGRSGLHVCGHHEHTTIPRFYDHDHARTGLQHQQRPGRDHDKRPRSGHNAAAIVAVWHDPALRGTVQVDMGRLHGTLEPRLSGLW